MTLARFNATRWFAALALAALAAATLTLYAPPADKVWDVRGFAGLLLLAAVALLPVEEWFGLRHVGRAPSTPPPPAP